MLRGRRRDIVHDTLDDRLPVDRRRHGLAPPRWSVNGFFVPSTLRTGLAAGGRAMSSCRKMTRVEGVTVKP